MTSSVPRLRMFGGPNGSGKSTIKWVLRPELVGIYINPDEIEQDIRELSFLDLDAYGVHTTQNEILPFFLNSSLLQKAGLNDEAERLSFSEGKLSFHQVLVNAYFASVAADFLRQKLLDQRSSFTFETVMSNPDKVTLLAKAQELGYRTYLYYVATENPAINIERVRSRVEQGGHDVPEDKIVSRYTRSLDLLMDAIRHSNRAYIFDNSTSQQTWLAEITDGEMLEMKTTQMPAWFEMAVWNKMVVGE
ncbi:MAG: zeta toxin family protein [Armatimonadota bacterium]|nr:zeta toxin family protein [Armatimonadota bacterium]